MMDGGDARYFVLHLFQLPKHLWYLLMLVGLYLALPVPRLIVKDRALTRYLIWILLVFGIVFGTIEGVMGFFESMAAEDFGFSLWKAFLADLDNLNMTFVPGYLCFFLLGHYIHEYGLGRWHTWIVRMAIPALLLFGALMVALSEVTGSYVYTLMLETNPLVAVASAGIFVYFRGPERPSTQDDEDSPIARAAVWTDPLALGVCLVHLAIIDALAHCLDFTVASYTPLLSVPLNSALVFCVSLGIAAALRRVPLAKRIMS